MDFKYVNGWVSQPDVCRFCLSASGSSDITISYVSDTGQKELYYKMLQESFGISLTYLTNGTSRMVCNLCIAQLKLAYAFKNQVLQSERHFNLYYKARAEHSSVQNIGETIKSEEPEIHNEISHEVIKNPEDTKHHTSNSRKDHPAFLKQNSKVNLSQVRKESCKLTCEKISEECSVYSEYDSDTPIAKIVETISSQVNKEIKNATIEDIILDDNEIVGIEDEPSRGKPVKIRDIKMLSERKRMKITCLTILRDTTACPFRHYKSWFRCFFCLTDFMQIQSLREHTIATHTDIASELQQVIRYPRSLQIEISELACKKCGFKMENVASMKNHLKLAHEQIIYSECIADYKIEKAPYSCHICGEQFHVFRTLTTHLNIHYANYICDVCGRPFLNTKRLKVHYRVHEKGNYPCKLCPKVLSTKSSRSNHMESVHSKRILKCHVCDKPMKHYNARVKHMSEEHHITHNFKCTICGREYNVKHYLATHMRQSHGAKDKKCEECGMAFITGHGLKKHMRKHTGEKPFSCPVCKKSYARGYTLKEHMRIHDSLLSCTEKNLRIL